MRAVEDIMEARAVFNDDLLLRQVKLIRAIQLLIMAIIKR